MTCPQPGRAKETSPAFATLGSCAPRGQVVLTGTKENGKGSLTGTTQLEWGAHAPSRAVFRALAEHTGACTTQPFGVCLRLEATGEGAARNTRGRVCSPKFNCMDQAKRVW